MTLLFYLTNHSEVAYDARKNELKHIVSLAKNTIQPLLDKQNAGLLSKQESMNEGVDILNRMTFLDSYGENYIFLTTYDGVMQVIPFEPEKRGVNQWDLQDSQGKYLIRELVTLATSSKSEGFLDYTYLPPGRSETQKKISYIIGIPEWNAYLGTGMYTGDLERYNKDNVNSIILITLLTIVIVILSNLLLVRPLYLCYGQLRSLFEKVKNTPNMAPTVDLSVFKKGTEGEKLLSSFKSMINEIYNSRNELKLSKERFDSILKATNDGIWDWDITTNNIYFSSRWKAMLGYQEDDSIINLASWASLVSQKDADRVLDDLTLFLSSDRLSYSQTFRMIHKNGEHRWILSRGHLLRDGDGQCYRMIGADTDITEQRNATATLERQRNELAHISRVAVMGELTATIAHEINQPLAAIGSNAHAALRFLNSDKPNLEIIQDILSDIVVDNNRAAEVIRRLRALLIKGKVEVKPYNLNSIINEASSIISEVAQLYNIKIEKEFSVNLPCLLGDSIQIQQVLVNLFLNAIEALKNDGGIVKVKTTKNNDGKVVISVTNRGATFAESNLDTLFEPFYSTKENGMGMGLSICRTIIEAHDGEIMAKYIPPETITFVIFLPVNE
jgi:PAS domain S-box-containing protein